MPIEKLLQINAPSPLQELTLESGKQLWCKRDDQLHDIISGNKWRKLKPLVEQLVLHPQQHIASFGGAYSNHLHALSYLCNQLNIRFTALVRAHPHSALTPTLQDLTNWGASIHFLSRHDYKRRDDKTFLTSLQADLSIDTLVPEGGSSPDSLNGVADIFRELQTQDRRDFDLIVLPVASGGTMAGLIKYIQAKQLDTKVLGIAVLKGQGYLEQLVTDLLLADTPKPPANSPPARHTTHRHWEIVHDERYHCGGYAKVNAQLLSFKHSFYQQHNIKLDNIYNTKSFYALSHLISEKKLDEYQRILILHTGGLQGDRS